MKHVSIYECQLEKILYVRPVIFIPGIMGSKLQNAETGDRVWDPDDELTWGAWHAVKSSTSKREDLIGPPTQNGFNPNFLEIFYDPEEEEVKETDRIRKESTALRSEADTERYRRWSGLAQSFYADFLQSIDGYYELKEKTWVIQRVYAHPYNWTGSNQTSAEELAKTVDYAIKDTQEWVDIRPGGIILGRMDTEIDVPTMKTLKPIILTHSMGGLVARGYTQSDNWENGEKIAGVLHVAMPTDGSPATYANMLSGSNAEWRMRYVLGATQKQVTATAGNMPGALELLPNHVYKDSTGLKATNTLYTRGWMRIYGRDGKIASSWPSAMPTDDHSYTGPQKGKTPNGDPYEQIYLNQDDWWRLIYKEYLNPDGDHDAAFAAYRQSIVAAKKFHIQINKNGKFHPNTRMLYSDSAAEEFQACEAVRWNLTKGNLTTPPKDALFENDYKGTLTFRTYHVPKNIKKYKYSAAAAVSSTIHAQFKLQRITAPGDATVHMGAAAYEEWVLTRATENGFDHTNAFDNDEVRNWVLEQLDIMAKEDIACMPVE